MLERRLKAGRRRLFVIDGSKASRKAIDEVFGGVHPVQRCRPDERKGVLQLAMKAALKLDANKGIAKLKKLAEWLGLEEPSAADSLLEGLDEMWTSNRPGLPCSLRRCLGTTNCIESPYSGARGKTRRITSWRDGQMVVRWADCALAAVQRHMKRISGFQQLWILDEALKESWDEKDVAMKERGA